MNLTSDAKMKIFAALLIAINLTVLGFGMDFKPMGPAPSLDISKEFANDLVNNLQDLAISLEVEDQAVVRQALAQLHYDTFLITSRPDLISLIQRDASDVRRLIIEEYNQMVGKTLISVLNNSPVLEQLPERSLLVFTPLPEGGFSIEPDDLLGAELNSELAEVENLFNHSYFRPYYQTYKADSTFEIEVDWGTARLLSPVMERMTRESWQELISELRSEYSRVSRTAGFSEITGAGIRLEILGELTARELRQIVDELFISGAYAVAVGGQRLAVNSYILDSGDNIEVDGMVIATRPLVVEALGDAAVIRSGVRLLLEQVLWHLYVEIEYLNSITLPGKSPQ